MRVSEGIDPGSVIGAGAWVVSFGIAVLMSWVYAAAWKRWASNSVVMRVGS